MTPKDILFSIAMITLVLTASKVGAGPKNDTACLNTMGNPWMEYLCEE